MRFAKRSSACALALRDTEGQLPLWTGADAKKK